VGGALVEVFACLTDRDARTAGGGADVGDRGIHGVLPEVVGLPPRDLIEEVRLGSAADGCCSQDCVLDDVIVPDDIPGLGVKRVNVSVLVADVDGAARRERAGTAGAIEGVGDAEERVVPRWQRSARRRCSQDRPSPGPPPPA